MEKLERMELLEWSGMSTAIEQFESMDLVGIRLYY